ncbi:hypothetical protein [Pedobacter sp. Leaf250]|uniref:hypothetical protein n=1 Tax=Pedobacter sp. Leaf250 TaxID=2876559 RepID=UPI001E31E9F7|nr:hypothetical protein [Pedobacter sp. Leaf250]
MKQFKFLLALSVGIMLNVLIVASVAQFSGHPEYFNKTAVTMVTLVSIVLGATVAKQQGVLNTLTVAAIIAEWGLLYRAGAATVKDLMIALMVKSETEAIFARRVTESTVMEKAFVEFQRVLQAYQNKWTPIGGATFTPEKIDLFKLKIDVEEYPDNLEQTWLGFLADGNLDRKQWPFTKWYQLHLIAKSVEDYEKFEIFGGVPSAIVPGVANAAGTNVLGIKKQLNMGHAAGQTLTVAVGAVPTDPVEFVDYIEEMYAMAVSNNEVLLADVDAFNMSHALERRFKTGMRKKYNENYSQTDLVTIIDTNIGIRGLNSHSGSNKIWATPAWNRQCGIKKPQNESIMQVENVDRLVKFYTDFYKGVGFWHKGYIVQNDVELV